MRRISPYFALLAIAAFAACRSPQAAEDDGRPVVVATTTMLADLAAQIGGDAIRVEGILRPGGDPHLYQPTPADARLVASSDLVVTSGLHLEGWMDDLVRNAGGERPVVVASAGIEPIGMPGTAGGVDPHFWFDLSLWRRAAANVGAGLVALAGDGTASALEIRARLAGYEARCDRLDAWIRDAIATVPERQRVLLTSHDAFNYFGRAYGIEVVGLQGISTAQEASQRDVANAIDLVRSRRVPAVFIETSVNPALVEQVARETGAAAAGPLYSDSIGAAGTPAATFLGTVAENVRMVVTALDGTWSPLPPAVALGSEAGR